MCGCLSHGHTGYLSHNLHMCPDWEVKQPPFDSLPMLHPLSYTSRANANFLKWRQLCFFFLNNFLKIFIVIQLQLYAFSPHPSTLPQPNPPPSPTSTLPLGFVHVSFIVVLIIPSSHCPPPQLLLDCS